MVDLFGSAAWHRRHF